MKEGTIRGLRRGFLGLTAIQALVVPTLQHQALEALSNPALFGFLVVAVITSPFMMLFVIGLQFVFSPDEKWPVPTSDSNPLVSPLAFGHLAAQVGVVASVSTSIAGIWCGWQVLLIGTGSLLVGCGWFLGLLWCMRKFEPRVIPPGGRPQLLDV